MPPDFRTRVTLALRATRTGARTSPQRVLAHLVDGHIVGTDDLARLDRTAQDRDLAGRDRPTGHRQAQRRGMSGADHDQG
jgi:hypothetical protein